MTKTKTDSKTDLSKKAQDKTDWKTIYNQTQSVADRIAAQDTENPVLKNARFKRMHDKN